MVSIEQVDGEIDCKVGSCGFSLGVKIPSRWIRFNDSIEDESLVVPLRDHHNDNIPPGAGLEPSMHGRFNVFLKAGDDESLIGTIEVHRDERYEPFYESIYSPKYELEKIESIEKKYFGENGGHYKDFRD